MTYKRKNLKPTEDKTPEEVGQEICQVIQNPGRDVAEEIRFAFSGKWCWEASDNEEKMYNLYWLLDWLLNKVGDQFKFSTYFKEDGGLMITAKRCC